MVYDLIVVGAGAGGCFTAIRLAELFPGAKICILEAARKPLGKVEISGGGRCNVTHACFDPVVLSTYYPRGQQELIKPFTRFQPRDMINWFAKKNVRIKQEADGRMFPDTDTSTTIIFCFLQSIKKTGIELRTSTRVTGYKRKDGIWTVDISNDAPLQSRYLMVSSGSDQRMWEMLKGLGHTIVPPVPSLFTFQIKDKALTELQGVSKTAASVSIPPFNLKANGPLLITHWGLSGPGILRLSAWGARELNACGYAFDLVVNWAHDQSQTQMLEHLKTVCRLNPKKQLSNITMEDFPVRLWKYLCNRAGLPEKVNCSELGTKFLSKMASIITGDVYPVTGKSTFKEEFVTAGGVDVAEIDFDKFESRLVPGLFLVGEVLNIDAITGGFNFQAAWTGAEIAAQAIAKHLAS